MNLKFIIRIYLILIFLNLPSQSYSLEFFQKKNLSLKINTQYDEMMPILTSDGKTLYFCRIRHPENIGESKKGDIWYSTLDSNGNWDEPKNMGEPLNNEYSNAVCSVTPDGNSLIIGGNYIIKNELVGGIFESVRTKTGWSKPRQLIIKNFYMNSQYISCCMSSDRTTLILALQREDSYGGLDLYACSREIDGTWTEPVNLGKDINTSEDDNTPFLAADNHTLYFSSKGHDGYGNYDVFLSRRIGESWTEWSKPENLGVSINTPGGDANYIISSNGEYAYYSSTENSYGGWDIFRIDLPKEVKPNPIILFSGNVSNKLTHDPIAAKIYYQSFPQGVEIGTAIADPATGDFKISLPVGRLYRVHLEATNFLSQMFTIDAREQKEFSEQNQKFELSPADSLINELHKFKFDFLPEDAEIPQYLDILPVEIIQKEIFDKITMRFDYNKVPVKPEALPGIRYIIRILKRYPDFTLVIIGHTDNRGTAEYNKTLSEQRAIAIGDFLIENGIGKKRITTKGAGFSIPLSDNDTEEGMAENRRGVFLIFKH